MSAALARALLAFVVEPANAVLAQREFVFHLAYRLLQQHVGFFESIEHRVQVRGEQPTHRV